jgi:Bacterial Ig domain
VYVDGVSKATGGSGASFQASVAMSAGTHRVTVKAWDSTGRGISGTVNITVSGSGGGGGTCSAGALYTVHLCSPANGGTYSSPVPVSATANSDHSITGWKLYVDGTFKASAGAVKSWNTSVAMSSGSHRVTVKAWDSTGRVMSATGTITVH